jgi:hypothetical protein
LYLLLDIQSVISQQLQWDIMQGVNGIRRKADQHMGVHHPSPWFSRQVGPIPPVAASPSDVFSQPNKIGNVLLPAFAEKVDLAIKVDELKKIQSLKVEFGMLRHNINNHPNKQQQQQSSCEFANDVSPHLFACVT